MRGNHLFGIFSPEKLKKVIPPCGGNHLFGIFSPEKLKKVIPPHRAPGVQGGAQMRGNHLFSIFSG